jgi:hypothetical protein
MGVEAILQRARDLGITLRLAGDRIQYAPKSLATEDFVRALSQHKAEMLAYLVEHPEPLTGKYLFKYSGPHGPTEAEALEIKRRVQQQGYVLLWSIVLQDLVAIYRMEEDRKRVPPGFVPYSEKELQTLFGATDDTVSSNSLRLIHQVKKLGGRIAGSESNSGTSTS